MNDSKRALPSWLPIAGLLVGAVAVMLLLWFLVIEADEDAEQQVQKQAEPAQQAPRIVDADELADAAERVGHPIYWAGRRPRTQIELAESDSGGVYVRYLAPGVEPGVQSTDFMTVATYPVEDAVAALRRGVENRPGAHLARGENGALILVDPSAPSSLRIAYPGSDEQVELYSPNVEAGLRLATSGDIEPVPAK